MGGSSAPSGISWGHLCSFIQGVPGLGWIGTSKMVVLCVWVLMSARGASLVVCALRWSFSPCGALYWFPVAAVTNYHKVSGLNNTHVFSQQISTSEVLKWRYWQGCDSSQALQGRICFLAFPTFQIPPVYLSSWSDSPSSKLIVWDLPIFFFLLPLSYTFSCVSLIKILVITLGSPR